MPSPSRGPTTSPARSPASSAATGSTRADFIENRVLPYSNQQVSGTFGGPIVRDRAHFFGNYEIEREPRTVTFSSPFPAFNIDQLAENRQNKGVARFDAQFSPQTRFYARVPEVLLRPAVRRDRRRDEPPVHCASRAPLQRPVVLHLHAGARQPRRQRNQGRLRALRLHARLAREVDGRLLPRTHRSTAAAR